MVSASHIGAVHHQRSRTFIASIAAAAQTAQRTVARPCGHRQHYPDTACTTPAPAPAVAFAKSRAAARAGRDNDDQPQVTASYFTRSRK